MVFHRMKLRGLTIREFSKVCQIQRNLCNSLFNIGLSVEAKTSAEFNELKIFDTKVFSSYRTHLLVLSGLENELSFYTSINSWLTTDAGL
jgi:hypothetical protein